MIIKSRQSLDKYREVCEIDGEAAVVGKVKVSENVGEGCCWEDGDVTPDKMDAIRVTLREENAEESGQSESLHKHPPEIKLLKSTKVIRDNKGYARF